MSTTPAVWGCYYKIRSFTTGFLFSFEIYCSDACTGSHQLVSRLAAVWPDPFSLSRTVSLSLYIIFKHFPLCKQISISDCRLNQSTQFLCRFSSELQHLRDKVFTGFSRCHPICEIHFLLLSHLLPTALPCLVLSSFFIFSVTLHFLLHITICWG